MEDNGCHIAALRELLTLAAALGIPLWLENGWAIDARLGRIPRPHDDIDIAYPKDREADYRRLIEDLGYARHEPFDYGFLSWRGLVCLDSEPCHWSNGEYGFDGFPLGSCPEEFQGAIADFPVRCVSWEAMYFEMLGYIENMPREDWRPKDFESLRVVEASLNDCAKEELRRLHRVNANDLDE